MTSRKRPSYPQFHIPRTKKRRAQAKSRKPLLPKHVSTEIKTFDTSYTDSTPYELPEFVDITFSESFLTSDETGGGCCINEIVQGTGSSQRIGSKITIKSIRLRCTLSCATATTNSVRICLVYDKQPNLAFPTLATIFQDSTATTSFVSSLNMSNVRRFVVLRDSISTFNTDGPLGRYVNKLIKRKIICDYSSSDGDIGDISGGSILLLAGSSSYIHTTNAIHIKFNTRIRYYDF